MQTLLKHWADALLEWLGLASAQDSGWDRWVAFTLVLLAVALFDFVCRTILVRGMRRIVKRTKATWDDDLFNPDVLSRLCNVVSAVVLGDRSAGGFRRAVRSPDDSDAAGRGLYRCGGIPLYQCRALCGFPNRFGASRMAEQADQGA